MKMTALYHLNENIAHLLEGFLESAVPLIAGLAEAIGLFIIVQIVRNVQMLIPTYDFCIPEKECTASSSDSPCDVFSRIDFPTDEFFPPKAGGDYCESHCSCCQSGQSSSGCSGRPSCSR